MILKAGTILADRFTIISPLGSESTPTIYKVFDKQAQCNSAIKVIAGAQCSAERKDELQHKIRQISALSHPNIAHIEKVYEESELLFYTLELCDGESMYSRLRNEISRQDCDLWLKQIQSAMQAFHQIGCQIGEVRIDKILIDINNNIHVMDFATQTPENACYEPGTIADLRAPEVKMGETPTAKSDVYSLGMLAHLLSSCVNPDELNKENKARVKLIKQAAKKISVESPDKRPDIIQVGSLLSRQKEGFLSPKNIMLSFSGAIVLAWVINYFVLSVHDYDSLDGSRTQNISVLTDDSLQQITAVASLLYYPINNWSQFSVVPPKRVSNFVNNLALKPLDSSKDFAKVTEAFALNYVITISSRQTSQTSYLFSAQLKSNKQEGSIFEVNKRATAQTLDRDLSELSILILEAIANWSSNEVEKDYSTFFDLALRVTDQTGSKFKLLTEKLDKFPEIQYKAILQTLESDSQSAAQAMLAPVVISNDKSYWSLMLNRIAAQISGYPTKELAIIEEIEQLFPDRIEVLKRKAALLDELGEKNKADLVLRKALTLNKQHPDILFSIAKLKLDRGLYQEAIDNELSMAQLAYRQQNNVYEESRVKIKFGEAYIKLGQPKTALRFFKEALDLLEITEFPLKRADIFKQIADISIENLDYEKAEKELLSAIEIYKRSNDVTKEVETWLKVADVQQTAGKASDSLITLSAIYAKVRKEASGDDYLRLKIALAKTHYLLGQLAEANSHIKYVVEQIELLPTDLLSEVFIVESKIRLLQGDLDAANAALQRYNTKVTTSEKSFVARLQESRLAFLNGNLAESQRIIDALIEASANNGDVNTVEAYLWQAELCLLIADFACAELNRVEANKYLQTNMSDLQIKDIWLTTAIAHSSGANRGMSPDLFFDFLSAQQMSVSERLGYLIDIQERFDLSFDSEYARAIERSLKQEFILLNLEYNLSRAKDTADFSEVNRQLGRIPRYWRYHYMVRQLRKFDKLDDDINVTESLMLQQMTEIQLNNYKRYYQ
ncbi:protein kinase [Glaciecola sp. KUL10]|uniref:protein kinase domain-containing protein n=1 Tax=Glaciecola sp. (strain KUL10) TaxID=2161813 RepID=UPI000D786C22|nr:protein kinase [Glaciecola sp. KUL10]GBL03240.1 hypothetical protein KUL10_05220 [Glaciecola sp. KUL10]